MNDNTAKCTPTTIVVVNPPTKPNLTSPADKEVIYYSGNTTYNPKFEWNEPESWGWIPENSNKEYTFFLTNAENGSTVDEFPLNENSRSRTYDSPLPDGIYRWFVKAKYGPGETASDNFTFEKCTLKCDGEFDLIYPKDNDIVTNSTIEFEWKGPSSCSKCGDTSSYNYTITISKGTIVKYFEAVEENQTKANFFFDEDYSYTWKLEAFGPKGVITFSSSNTFTVCTPEKPDPPVQLKTDKTDLSGITPCFASDGNLNYTFSWKKPTKVGKSCTGSDTSIINYKLQIRDSGSVDIEENITTSPEDYENSHWKELSCSNKSYKAYVWAWNGYAYSDPAVIDFGICERSVPGDISDVKVTTSYCRETTEIAWDYSEWGKTCSGGKNSFTLNLTSGNDAITVPIAYQEDGHYVYGHSLAEGEWEMKIVATNKDGLNSNIFTEKFIAHKIPDIGEVKVENLGTGVRFTWTTDKKFLDCAASVSTFKYKLEYTVDAVNDSISVGVSENVETTIGNIAGTIVWCVKLMDGEEEVKGFKCGIYSTDKNCVPVQPKWDDLDNALISPDGKDPVFGKVTFKWKEPRPGISCLKETQENQENGEEGTRRRRDVINTEAESGFFVIVENQNETSNTTSRDMKIEGYGNKAWHVVAFVGDVTSEATTNKTFCYSPSPEIPKLKEYNPHDPNIVSWENVSCKNLPKCFYFTKMLLFFLI